jgi:hypothetical protein
MANNPNQNQGKQDQSKQDHSKQGHQEGQQGQSQAGREVNPSRPSGEPGKLPQNAGSALNSGGTATHQQQQSKSQGAQGGQSKSMRDEGQDQQRTGTPANRGSDSRASQDVDAPTGIGQAVRKGEAETDIDGGNDDLGNRSGNDKGGRDNKAM